MTDVVHLHVTVAREHSAVVRRVARERRWSASAATRYLLELGGQAYDALTLGAADAEAMIESAKARSVPRVPKADRPSPAPMARYDDLW